MTRKSVTTGGELPTTEAARGAGFHFSLSSGSHTTASQRSSAVLSHR